VPAGLIVGGLALTAFGLLAVDVDQPKAGDDQPAPLAALEPGDQLDQAIAQVMGFNGLQYPLLGRQTLGTKTEEISADFQGLIEGAYKDNGVVFACMLARQLLFSEARFQFRRVRNGRPGELFGTPALSVLEKPWQNATTGDLLSRAIQDVDLEGNFYGAIQAGKRGRRSRGCGRTGSRSCSARQRPRRRRVGAGRRDRRLRLPPRRPRLRARRPCSAARVRRALRADPRPRVPVSRHELDHPGDPRGHGRRRRHRRTSCSSSRTAPPRTSSSASTPRSSARSSSAGSS
jgi:hypothetical protein